jgi:hypothetical protein
VIANLTGEMSEGDVWGDECPDPYDQCRATWYFYTLHLNDIPAWSAFSGTCSVVITGGSLAGTRNIDCDETTVPIGTGDGDYHTFTVRACTTSCVSSASLPDEYLWPTTYVPSCGQEIMCTVQPFWDGAASVAASGPIRGTGGAAASGRRRTPRRGRPSPQSRRYR